MNWLSRYISERRGIAPEDRPRQSVDASYASRAPTNAAGLATAQDRIARFGSRRSLDLSGLGLTILPENVTRLKGLNILILSNNKLTGLPRSIGRLTDLVTLDLDNNQLSELPESVFKLVGLQGLVLSSNRLTHLPDAIGHLSGLRNLDISQNRLSTLPEGLRQLTSLRTLYLHDNPALGLPSEVLGRGVKDDRPSEPRANPTAILEYYFRTRGGQQPLSEAKLILVGFGNVGKTSLVNRLIVDRFDPYEARTDGIAITDWPIRLNSKEEVRLHIWDFGGQEIMHATHQFFLTQRSLYLLVLNGRQGREDADAAYWLNLIASHAPHSPVIIVLNKIKEHQFSITRSALHREFANIREVVQTDCADRTGIDLLTTLIRRETEALPHLRDKFPAAWFTIKNRLSTMTEDYLTFEQYRSLCAEHGERDLAAQETLAGFLHALGIALNYKDDPRLQDMNVLNPRWVTEGVYAILSHDILARQKGVLRLGDLSQILDIARYPRARHDFILQLMRKFELAFQFTEQEEYFLVPELLDKEQPSEARAFASASSLHFEYHYSTPPPEGLLPRFIVRTYILSENNPRWRSGVILQLEGNRALVIADPISRRVYVTIDGPASGLRRLLAVVRSDFDRIHASYKNRPKEMVPVPGCHDRFIRYSKLLAFERSGKLVVEEEFDGQVVMLSVKELLDGVDLECSRALSSDQDRVRPRVRAFISYSHKDDRLRAELETHLKLLQRQKVLDVWSDHRILPGTEWRGAINENLEKADLILFLVSPDFIASDYCYDIEMRRAMERHEVRLGFFPSSFVMSVGLLRHLAKCKGYRQMESLLLAVEVRAIETERGNWSKRKFAV
jgi:internalin A